MSDRHDRWTGQEMLFARSRKVRQRGTGMSKPTIHELEKIIDDNEPGTVSILPDGSVVVDERIATLEANNAYLTKVHQTRCNEVAILKDRVKAADDALFLAIKNKEKAEDDERLGRTRIATLEAELKARDLAIKCLLEGKKELEGELAQWQRNYINRIDNPKQRQAYLAQLEKRKERG